MRTLSRALPVVLAVAVALVGGTLHGRWTDRWRLAHDLQESVDRIARLPQSIGTWTGEDLPQTEGHRETLLENGFVAWAERVYTDSVTGAQVNILLISGRPGPIATHTPEDCYSGAGYAVTSTRPVSIEGPGLPPERFLLSELRRGGGGSAFARGSTGPSWAPAPTGGWPRTTRGSSWPPTTPSTSSTSSSPSALAVRWGRRRTTWPTASSSRPCPF